MPAETRNTSLATCPHCGKEFEDSWELCQKDEDIYEYDCDQCEKPFAVQAHISVTYTTTKIEESKEE
jgi:transcription elongation factor Elf1